jgi:hypothetical protein
MFFDQTRNAPPYRVNWLRSEGGRLEWEERKVPPEELDAFRWPFYSPDWGVVVSSLTGERAPWVAEGIERSHVFGDPLPAALASLPDPSLLPFGPPFDVVMYVDFCEWEGAVRTFRFADDQVEWWDAGRDFEDWEEIEDNDWVAEWRDGGWVLLDPSTLDSLAEIPELLRWSFAQGRAWADRLKGAVLAPDD